MNESEVVGFRARVKQVLKKVPDVEVEIELYGKEDRPVIGVVKEVGKDYLGVFRIAEVESEVLGEDNKKTKVFTKYYVNTLLKFEDMRAVSIVEPVTAATK